MHLCASSLAAVAFLLAATTVAGYQCDPFDVALAEASLLVTGNVVAVADAGLLECTHTITTRQLGYDDEPWLFPHSRAQLVGDELRFLNRFGGADLPRLRVALAPAQVVATASGFTAVTLNLWHDQHDWPARRAVIVDTLRALAPDVIFLQEVLEKEGLPNQARQLADSLDCAFVFTSVDPVGGPKRYGNAILTRLPIVAVAEVKLPPLDDYRMAAHARIEMGDGRALDAYVTHLHHTEEGAAIRAEQVAGLLAFIDSTRTGGANEALLLGGDFNAEPARPELAPMFARFTDALAAVHPGLAVPAAATFGPATGTTPRRIDYLFCDGAQLAPTAARVVLGAPSPAGVWGSDHCGVWARFGAAAGTAR